MKTGPVEEGVEVKVVFGVEYVKLEQGNPILHAHGGCYQRDDCGGDTWQGQGVYNWRLIRLCIVPKRKEKDVALVSCSS